MKKESRSIKSALISSIIVMLICIAMLSGSTYAWYTASVSNTGNKIQAGTLGIVIQQSETAAFSNYTTLDNGSKIGLTDVTGVNPKDPTVYTIEPGRKYETAYFRVMNTGNLYIKFKLDLSLDIGSEEMTKHITVSVSNGTTTSPVGKLYDLIHDTDSDGFAYGYLSPVQTEDNNISTVNKIVLTVDDNIGSEFMGHKMEGLTINVVASQYAHEKDGFGTSDYDKDSPYPSTATVVKTASQLRNLINSTSAENAKNATIVLGNEINLNDDTTLAEGDVFANVYGNVSIVGNGYTIKVPTGKTFIKTYKNSNLNLDNVTIKLFSNTQDAQLTDTSEGVFAEYFNSLTLKNVHFIGIKENGLTVGANPLADTNTVLIDGCTFNKTTLKLVGGKGINEQLNNVTIQNCTFTPYSADAKQPNTDAAGILFANSLYNIKVTNNTFKGFVPYRINTTAPAADAPASLGTLGTCSVITFEGNTYDRKAESDFAYMRDSANDNCFEAFKVKDGVTWKDTPAE